MKSQRKLTELVFMVLNFYNNSPFSKCLVDNGHRYTHCN